MRNAIKKYYGFNYDKTIIKARKYKKHLRGARSGLVEERALSSAVFLAKHGESAYISTFFSGVVFKSRN